MSRILGSTLALAVAIFLTPSLHAATVFYDINLDGLQELPPVATPGYGTGTLTLNDVTGGYSISGNFYSLIGTSQTAQLRGPAAIGASGALISMITFDPGVTSGAFSHAGTFTPGQMTDLQNELFYINITSTAFLSGEVRGQIRLSLVPEPGSVVLLGCGGLVVLAAIGLRRKRRGE